MPVLYEIEPDKGLIRTQCVGAVTLAEVLEHFGVLERDPGRPDHLDVLLDLSELLSFPAAGQLRAVSEEIGRVQVRFGACAIVATKDVVFGLARMFETFAEGRFRSIRVFRGVAEAEAWLQSERGAAPDRDPEVP